MTPIFICKTVGKLRNKGWNRLVRLQWWGGVNQDNECQSFGLGVKERLTKSPMISFTFQLSTLLGQCQY